MKKKIILGFLVLLLLLFFITYTWALKEPPRRNLGHPEQDMMQKAPVAPQSIDTYPSMIKFIFIPGAQSFPVLIYIERSSTQALLKVKNSTKTSTTSPNKTR